MIQRRKEWNFFWYRSECLIIIVFSTFVAPSNALQEETEPVEQSHFTPDILTDWDHRQWQGKLRHSKQKGVSGSPVWPGGMASWFLVLQTGDILHFTLYGYEGWTIDYVVFAGLAPCSFWSSEIFIWAFLWASNWLQVNYYRKHVLSWFFLLMRSGVE